MASTKFYVFLLLLPAVSSKSQCFPLLSLYRSRYSRNPWDEVWAISHGPGLINLYGKVKDDFFIIAELGVVDHGGIVLVTVVFLDSGEESFIDGHSIIKKMDTSWSGRWLIGTCSSWWFLFSRDQNPGSTLCIWACWVWLSFANHEEYPRCSMELAFFLQFLFLLSPWWQSCKRNRKA